MKSELDISLNQYKILALKMNNLISECKKVISANKTLIATGNVSYNPVEKLEKLIKEYDNSY